MNYRETRRSEADWEQFAADQHEYIAQLERESDGWKRGFEAELRVSATLREHLARLETEVERLKNIQEHYVKGVWDPND
jgi:hypothetical protein